MSLATKSHLLSTEKYVPLIAAEEIMEAIKITRGSSTIRPHNACLFKKKKLTLGLLLMLIENKPGRALKTGLLVFRRNTISPGKGTPGHSFRTMNVTN